MRTVATVNRGCVRLLFVLKGDLNNRRVYAVRSIKFEHRIPAPVLLLIAQSVVFYGLLDALRQGRFCVFKGSGGGQLKRQKLNTGAVAAVKRDQSADSAMKYDGGAVSRVGVACRTEIMKDAFCCPGVRRPIGYRPSSGFPAFGTAVVVALDFLSVVAKGSAPIGFILTGTIPCRQK